MYKSNTQMEQYSQYKNQNNKWILNYNGLHEIRFVLFILHDISLKCVSFDSLFVQNINLFFDFIGIYSKYQKIIKFPEL